MSIDSDTLYTAITFAPVQGFIEKSRKLRDLYGSSFILSYLANALCDAARNHAQRQGHPIDDPYEGYPVISPALIGVTQGTPNLIVVAGEFPQATAQGAFDQAWSAIATVCRSAIEQKLKEYDYRYWQREWSLLESHAWEFFHATGNSTDDAKTNLFQVKRKRNWTGINWTGESSTLSGADTIAYPNMNAITNPKQQNVREIEEKIKEYYQRLSQCWEESIIDPREQLSIPELIKRLVTVDNVTGTLLKVENPRSFQQLNRWKEDQSPDDADRENAKRWTGWFLGDGDRASDFLRNCTDEELHHFSEQMRNWGNNLKHHLPRSEKDRRSLDRDGRIIYAGGDDFLGVLYGNPPDSELTPKECLHWFYTFKPEIWHQPSKPITVSVGFVWAAPNVPQRDVLQHCREAEKSAKQSGRDRIALRILFNSGTYLEWVCPWWLLQPLLEGYRDRNQVQGNQANWTHLYNDIAVLESRHAFQGDQTEVAFALLAVYFPEELVEKLRSPTTWFNGSEQNMTGILGAKESFLQPKSQHLNQTQVNTALNTWIINLAKVGFHLCQVQTSS
jgi:CRISPR-associated protein Cmr2